MKGNNLKTRQFLNFQNKSVFELPKMNYFFKKSIFQTSKTIQFHKPRFQFRKQRARGRCATSTKIAENFPTDLKCSAQAEAPSSQRIAWPS